MTTHANRKIKKKLAQKLEDNRSKFYQLFKSNENTTYLTFDMINNAKQVYRLVTKFNSNQKVEKNYRQNQSES